MSLSYHCDLYAALAVQQEWMGMLPFLFRLEWQVTVLNPISSLGQIFPTRPSLGEFALQTRTKFPGARTRFADSIKTTVTIPRMRKVQRLQISTNYPETSRQLCIRDRRTSSRS